MCYKYRYNIYISIYIYIYIATLLLLKSYYSFLLMPEFPCLSCNINVNWKHRAVQCDVCDRWVHIKCNVLNNNDYIQLQDTDSPFYCIKCNEENIPLSKLSNKEI